MDMVKNLFAYVKPEFYRIPGKGAAPQQSDDLLGDQRIFVIVRAA
jgi:hypothetical protein